MNAVIAPQRPHTAHPKEPFFERPTSQEQVARVIALLDPRGSKKFSSLGVPRARFGPLWWTAKRAYWPLEAR